MYKYVTDSKKKIHRESISNRVCTLCTDREAKVMASLHEMSCSEASEETFHVLRRFSNYFASHNMGHLTCPDGTHRTNREMSGCLLIATSGYITDNALCVLFICECPMPRSYIEVKNVTQKSQMVHWNRKFLQCIMKATGEGVISTSSACFISSWRACGESLFGDSCWIWVSRIPQ